jgi:hypothetical protein
MKRQSIGRWRIILSDPDEHNNFYSIGGCKFVTRFAKHVCVHFAFLSKYRSRFAMLIVWNEKQG